MEMTLCELAEKYHTDKCPAINHSYTPFYQDLFAPMKGKIRKFLEIGVGRSKPSRNVISGASLRMWRDFFPNATIYGIDIRPGVLFQDDRIRTFLADATKEEDVKQVVKDIGYDIDVIMDDGSHLPEEQEATARILRPLFPKAIYIIEDVKKPERLELDGNYYIVKFIDKARSWRMRADNNIIVFK